MEELNLFTSEKVLVSKAKELLNSKNYDEKTLVDMLHIVIDQFNQLIKDMEKIIKISDNQQEYLQKVQKDLKREIDANLKMQKNLKYIASIDAKTGCFSRSMGIALLENEINNIKRNNDIFSICYVDINDLQHINDTLGHFESDEMVANICKIIKNVISDKDILCRLGKDEFIILFPKNEKKDAEKTMKEVAKIIKEENQKKVKPYDITFSYGIIQVNAEDNYTIDYIIR